jgi:hypothetical protein
LDQILIAKYSESLASEPVVRASNPKWTLARVTSTYAPAARTVLKEISMTNNHEDLAEIFRAVPLPSPDIP